MAEVIFYPVRLVFMAELLFHIALNCTIAPNVVNKCFTTKRHVKEKCSDVKVLVMYMFLNTLSKKPANTCGYFLTLLRKTISALLPPSGQKSQ